MKEDYILLEYLYDDCYVNKYTGSTRYFHEKYSEPICYFDKDTIFYTGGITSLVPILRDSVKVFITYEDDSKKLIYEDKDSDKYNRLGVFFWINYLTGRYELTFDKNIMYKEVIGAVSIHNEDSKNGLLSISEE